MTVHSIAWILNSFLHTSYDCLHFLQEGIKTLLLALPTLSIHQKVIVCAFLTIWLKLKRYKPPYEIIVGNDIHNHLELHWHTWVLVKLKYDKELTWTSSSLHRTQSHLYIFHHYFQFFTSVERIHTFGFLRIWSLASITSVSFQPI